MNEISITSNEVVQVRVSSRLKDILAAIQEEIAIKVKKEFNINEITISGTVASECLVGRYLKDKELQFKISKTSLNSGTIKIL